MADISVVFEHAVIGLLRPTETDTPSQLPSSSRMSVAKDRQPVEKVAAREKRLSTDEYLPIVHRFHHVQST
jgi:hypothetical protein